MDNYIFCRKKALDRKTSENVVEFVEKSEKLKNLRGYHYINANLRSPTFNFIRGVLISGIQEYREEHPFLKKSVGDATLHLDPDFMIKKFFPGDYYDCTRFSDPREAEHTEHGVDEDDSRRVLAWMFYLNDIKIEGGTCWPQQGFISKPEAGDLYIWPAGWTHSHYGIPAPKENKYFISGWCSLVKSLENFNNIPYI